MLWAGSEADLSASEALAPQLALARYDAELLPDAKSELGAVCLAAGPTAAEAEAVWPNGKIALGFCAFDAVACLVPPTPA